MSAVEVKSSTITGAGRGVFAARDISRGETACFYDGRIMKNIPPLCPERRYLLGTNFVGYSNPRNPSGVAQLINDGACLELGEFPQDSPLTTRLQYILSQMKRYEVAATVKKNVIWDHSPQNNFVCIKPIKAGEELFYMYELDYWLSVQREKSHDNPPFCEAITLATHLLTMIETLAEPKITEAVKEMKESLGGVCLEEIHIVRYNLHMLGYRTLKITLFLNMALRRMGYDRVDPIQFRKACCEGAKTGHIATLVERQDAQ